MLAREIRYFYLDDLGNFVIDKNNKVAASVFKYRVDLPERFEKSVPAMNEIDCWIADNLKGRWTNTLGSEITEFYFELEEDATIFKLFWG